VKTVAATTCKVSVYSSGLVIATSAALVTLVPKRPSSWDYSTIYQTHHRGSLIQTKSPARRSHARSGYPTACWGWQASATLGLILLAHERPLVRRLLAMKLVADGVAAGVNTTRQIASFRKLCSWCMATAICTTAMVVAGRKAIASELSGL
jgi:hypothetical protein